VVCDHALPILVQDWTLSDDWFLGHDDVEQALPG